MNSHRAPVERIAVISMILATGGGSAVSLAAAAEGPDETSLAQLEEVIVTASKREERLQNVPAAITAIDSVQIDRLGAKELADVARTVPGLVLTGGENSTQGAPSLRGVYSNTGEATVGFYIDDAPVQIRNNAFGIGSAALNLFDLDRIEVLRGPQGTLYGSSSMGGTIRFITAQPSLTTYSGRFKAEGSSTAHGDPSYEVGAAWGGPIKDTLGFRVSAYHREAGGYLDRLSRTDGTVVEEDTNSQQTTALKGALLLQLGDRFTLSPAFMYQSQKYDGLGIFRPELRDFQRANVADEPVKDVFYLPALTANYEFDDHRLTTIASYYDRKNDGNYDYSDYIANLFTGSPIVPVPGFENHLVSSPVTIEQRVFTAESRLVSTGDSRLQYIAGVYFTNDTYVRNQTIASPGIDDLSLALFEAPLEAVLGLPPLPGSVVFIGNQKATRKAYAAFGELSFAATERLKLTVGGRYEHSELGSSSFSDGPFNGGTTSDSGSTVNKPKTSKAGLSFQATDQTLFYLQAVEGFRSGGGNGPLPSSCDADLEAAGLTDAPSTRKPDTVWNYELGMKSSVSRYLSFSAAAYQIDWSDIQQAVPLNSCGFTIVANLGSARSRGVEAEVSLQPLRHLLLGASGSYVDAQFTKDTISGIDEDTQLPVFFNRAGDPVPNVPDLSFALWGEYRGNVSATWQAFVRADYQYVGKLFQTAPEGRVGYDPLTRNQRHYDYSSARIGVLNDRWEIAAFVNNISDNRPTINISSAFSQEFLRATSLPPRTIGITVSRSFE